MTVQQGEDALMEIKEVKGGLFLRPMRLMVQGEPTRWVKGRRSPSNLRPQYGLAR